MLTRRHRGLRTLLQRGEAYQLIPKLRSEGVIHSSRDPGQACQLGKPLSLWFPNGGASEPGGSGHHPQPGPLWRGAAITLAPSGRWPEASRRTGRGGSRRAAPGPEVQAACSGLGLIGTEKPQNPGASPRATLLK